MPASWRNRWAIAGGSGASKVDATTDTPAPATRAGRARGTWASGTTGLGDHERLEHLRDRVPLAADLQEEHVVGARARLAHLDLRPRRPAGRRTHGDDVEPAAPPERGGIRHDADRLRHQRLTLDHAALPREHGPIDDPALDGLSQDGQRPVLLDHPLGQERDPDDPGGRLGAARDGHRHPKRRRQEEAMDHDATPRD